MIIYKRLALFPDVRQQECHHEHFYWHGVMPCTGRLACSMCGYTQQEINALTVTTKGN